MVQLPMCTDGEEVLDRAGAGPRTGSELIDLIERLHDARDRLADKRRAIAPAEDAIEIASQGVDTQLAAYLNLSPTAADRVLRGLKIMVDRAAVAVAREQLQWRRADLAAQETLVEQLENKQEVAVKRLVLEGGELDRLSSAIVEAQSILQQAEEQIVQEQTEALKVAADDTQMLKRLYHQQRVINSQVEAAIARVRLIRLQAHRRLASLLADTTAVDTRDLRQQLADWKSQLAAIRGRATGWTEESEQERNRAADGMASGATLSGGAVPLFSVLYGDRLALAQQTLRALRRLDDLNHEVATFIRLVDEDLGRREGGVRDWLTRSELALQEFWSRTMRLAQESLFRIGDTPVTALGLLRVALIVFVAWWISYWFRRVLARLSRKYETVTQSTFYTIGRLFHYGMVTVGFMIGLASIGIDFTNFALVAGAIGIGIGFGLQSIVNNFVSGLILLFERTLKVGDFVELASGVAGEVRAINVRSTLINTNDNIDIVVPNSKFINDNVINWTLLETNCRIHIRFKVHYNADVDLVTKAGLEAAKKVPHTLKERKPSVWLVDFGDSSFDFELVVWITHEAVKRPGAVQAAYNREIATALRRYDIEVPVPQRELRMHSSAAKEASRGVSVLTRDKP